MHADPFSSDTLQNTVLFFAKAFPEPSDKNRTTQMGVHFEEIAEMLKELDGDTPHSRALLRTAHAAMHDLAEHSKKTGGIFVTDRQAFLDSIADQLVTATGCAYHHQMDAVGALNEVNRSNFSKFDDNGQPIFDENRKVTKGPNYSKPDLTRFI
jgi:predicted HAD superfamily Cof-like phosphohydrolase